jgi:peroxiredoxin
MPLDQFLFYLLLVVAGTETASNNKLKIGITMVKLLGFILIFALPTLSYGVEEGQIAPDCPALSAADTPILNLAAFRGKVVMLDFWATWCPPCAQSMPFLNSLRNEFKARGFEIIAINVDEDVDAVKPFLANHPVDYPIVTDPKGECPAIYDVQAMPSSYFVDKSGKVRFIHKGFRDGDQSEIRKQVMELLGE